MLGTGRPFVVCLDNPRLLVAACAEELQDKINAQTPAVQVHSLQVTSAAVYETLKAGEERKMKVYSCIVWTQDLQQTISYLDSLVDLTVYQKTPVRVLHRRSSLTREKKIHKMKTEPISDNLFMLRIITSAGTYVKEFVHGDLGRTSPSVGSLLSCKADIKQLDVLGLGWELSELEKLLEPPHQQAIHLITGNPHKFWEVFVLTQTAFEAQGYLLKQLNVDLQEIQGQSDEIVRDKASRAAEVVKDRVLVEDASLCFKAMNGLPGPYIKWIMQALDCEGLHTMLLGFGDFRAVSESRLAYCEPGAEPLVFYGSCEGLITKPRGDFAFGWDSVFQPEGSQKTFAEMKQDEKNTFSHRAASVQSFLSKWCLKNPK
jgi:inosine triphosphate pyrophosphatase